MDELKILGELQNLHLKTCGHTCPGGHVCFDMSGREHSHSCVVETLRELDKRVLSGGDRVESELLQGIGNRDLASCEVYADWLEERGKSKMAEYVRAQCGMVRFLCGSAGFDQYQNKSYALIQYLLPRWCWYITQSIVKEQNITGIRESIIAEQFRRCLGLRPWDEFAAEARRRNAEYNEKTKIGFPDYIELEQGTGGTTRLIIEALARYVVMNSDMMLLVVSARGIHAVKRNLYIIRDYAQRLGISLRYSIYDSREPDYHRGYRNYTYFQDYYY